MTLSKETTTAFYYSSIRLSTIEPGKSINLEIVEPTKKSKVSEPYHTLPPDIWTDPANNYSSGLKVTNEKGNILDVSNTAGGNLEGSDKVGIGFGIDGEDSLDLILVKDDSFHQGLYPAG